MSRRATVFKDREYDVWCVHHETTEYGPGFCWGYDTWDDAIADAIYWTGI